MNKHIPKKRWGQNFLVDSNIINKIIINLLILANNFESKSKPKKVACNAKNIQENIPK